MRAKTMLKNTIFAYREETTRGTAPSDSDNSKIVLARIDTVPTWNTGKEFLESQYMNGSMGRGAPIAGMDNEDIGFMVPVFARASGTAGTAPDYDLLLKHTLGSSNTGIGGTIAAAPTTTGFTITGGSAVVKNQLLWIEYDTGLYAVRRVTAVSGGNVVSVWPPLPSCTTGGTVSDSVTHILKSSDTDFSTGSGYFYFDGDKRQIYSGCMGKQLDINWEVGQRIDMQLTMQALSCPEDETAIGYAVVASDYQTATPPRCVALDMPIFYAGTVVTGSTTTSLIVTSPGGIEIETTDRVYVDVGSGVYESRVPSVVSGTGIGNKTCTITALSGAPTAGDTVLIEHTECVPSISLSLENTIDKDKCMHASSGYADQSVTDRVISIGMDNKPWKSILERSKLDATDPIEIFVIAGTAAGSIAACNIPNFYWSEISRGSENGKMTQSENGFAAVTDGNDEMILGWL